MNSDSTQKTCKIVKMHYPKLFLTAFLESTSSFPQPVKTNLNKKYHPKQNPSQTFNIDAKEFGKTKNENPLT